MAKDQDQNLHDDYINNMELVYDSNHSNVVYTAAESKDQLDSYVNMFNSLSQANVYSIAKEDNASDEEVESYINSITQLDPDSIILVQDKQRVDESKEKNKSKNNLNNLMLLYWWLNRSNNDGRFIADPFSFESIVTNDSIDHTETINTFSRDDLNYQVNIKVFSTKENDYLNNFSLTIDDVNYDAINQSELTIENLDYGDHVINVSADLHKSDTSDLFCKGINGKTFNIEFTLDQSTVYLDFIDKFQSTPYHRYNDFIIHDAQISQSDVIDEIANNIDYTETISITQYYDKTEQFIDEVQNAEITHQISISLDESDVVTIP